jgi:hypothetical protein
LSLMQTIDRNKKILTMGAPNASIVGLLAFFLFPGVALAPKAIGEPIQVKNIPVAYNTKLKKHHKKVQVVKRIKVPTPPVSQAIPVIFPKPTATTITVAAEPQLVKLDSYQNPLEKDAKKWDCVKDSTTGLTWEVKTEDSGLQDANNFYSWYSAGSTSQASNGIKDGGKCRGGIDCDTQSYINAINAKRVCGFSDWRLPTRKELLSLVQSGGQSDQKTMIDTRYFPNTPGDWYWTADTDLGNSDYAWYVLFYNGRTMKALKSQAKRVRLVRGGKEQSPSFKDFAEKKDSESRDVVAKQPFQPESGTTLKREMLSLN